MTGPRPGGGGPRAAALILGVSGVNQVAYGIAAIGGNAALEANVRYIETNPAFGKLFLSLGLWGVLLVLAGTAELVAALLLGRGSVHGWWMGLSAALFGLAVAFFTLAIFHFSAVASAVLLLAALYVLSYRVDH